MFAECHVAGMLWGFPSTKKKKKECYAAGTRQGFSLPSFRPLLSVFIFTLRFHGPLPITRHFALDRQTGAQQSGMLYRRMWQKTGAKHLSSRCRESNSHSIFFICLLCEFLRELSLENFLMGFSRLCGR